MADTGGEFEKIIAQLSQQPNSGVVFNTNGESTTPAFDDRSDNKAGEPEAVEIAEIGDKVYAFVGLERQGGVMVYNVTDAANPTYVEYLPPASGDRGPEILKYVPASESPTGQGLLLAANEYSGTVTTYEVNMADPAPGTYRLQILHASDFEAGLDAVDRAGNFAAIVDYLEETQANSITLSSGDNFLPSPFFNAGSDPSLKEVYENALEDYYNLAPGTLTISPGFGTADISMLNIIGVQASAIGNHEFDAGTNPLAAIIRQTAGYPGAQFPYLSANLDFSADPNLNPLYTSQIRDAADYSGFPPAATIGKKIAPAAIITENGEKIGIVGATTQIVQSISSTGGVEVIGPNADDMAALAAILQPTIDALLAQGINKVIVVSHLQQLALEQALAPLLRGVDIIVAGGSHTLLADQEDVSRGLQPGDTADSRGYPIVTANADGKTTLIVNTDSEYSYVGRLVVDFDANGDIIPGSVDPSVSGAFATTNAGVTALYANPIDIDRDGDIDTNPFVSGSRGDLVNDIAQGVGAIINQQDANIFGQTSVYLEGRRGEVRTEETNLGNLSSDANLWYAQKVDGTVLVSVKNGGGVRDSIGTINPDPNNPQELPPAANPEVGKEQGDISQLDIANSLRFNNALSLVTVTSDQMLLVLEHAVRASAPGATPGQFGQFGGISYSYDDDLPAGQRVVSAALIDENGDATTVIVRDGEVVADAPQSIRVVTLSFLLTGGEGYPFQTFINANPSFANVVNLGAANVPDAGQVATFAAEGTEQDAFAEYLSAFYSDAAYSQLDTTPAGDTRIQNLDFRNDTVFEGDDTANTLSLRVSQDAFQGNAQFIVTVDGQQIGGVNTVTTLHSSGQYQTFNFANVMADDISQVGVKFINDAFGGSADTDRNLYVDSLTFNGMVFEAEDALNTAGPTTGKEAVLAMSSGALTFDVQPSLTLRVSGDAFQGNAQFIVKVDGQQVGDVQTVTAVHDLGQYQDITIRGDFAFNPGSVSVQLVNDLYGGSANLDRNLYVDRLTIDGRVFEGEDAVNTAGPSSDTEAYVASSTGELTFDTRSSLTLRVSEDAYQGDVQFIVSVDGQQVGGVQTTSASHSAGAFQDLTIFGNFDQTPSSVSIQLLNDLYGGSPSQDRNLYVDSLTINGQVFEAEDATNTAGPSSDTEAFVASSVGSLVFDTHLFA